MSTSPLRLSYTRRSKSSSSSGMDSTSSGPRVSKARASRSRTSRSRPSRSPPSGPSGMNQASFFVSPEAATFFREVVVKRQFVAERSYQIEALPSDALSNATQLFSHYHLNSLNAISGKFNASVVREFYANLPADVKESNYCVRVRNVSVILRPSVINRVLGFRSCPGFTLEQYQHVSSQYTIEIFQSLAYTNPSLPLTPKGLPIKSYLSPFFKFLWDFVRHNLLPTGNNSNPTLAGCQLMISLINRDQIPLGDILFQAILAKSIGHGRKHKGSLIFPCLINQLCERAHVPLLPSDQSQPALAPYGKGSVSLSQKVSRTFLSSGSSASDSAALRAQLAEKDKQIQRLLRLIPRSSHSAQGSATPSSTAGGVSSSPDSDPTGSEDSLDSLGF